MHNNKLLNHSLHLHGFQTLLSEPCLFLHIYAMNGVELCLGEWKEWVVAALLLCFWFGEGSLSLCLCWLSSMLLRIPGLLLCKLLRMCLRCAVPCILHPWTRLLGFAGFLGMWLRGFFGLRWGSRSLNPGCPGLEWSRRKTKAVLCPVSRTILLE